MTVGPGNRPQLRVFKDNRLLLVAGGQAALEALLFLCLFSYCALQTALRLPQWSNYGMGEGGIATCSLLAYYLPSRCCH